MIHGPETNIAPGSFRSEFTPETKGSSSKHQSIFQRLTVTLLGYWVDLVGINNCDDVSIFTAVYLVGWGEPHSTSCTITKLKQSVRYNVLNTLQLKYAIWIWMMRIIVKSYNPILEINHRFNPPLLQRLVAWWYFSNICFDDSLMVFDSQIYKSCC